MSTASAANAINTQLYASSKVPTIFVYGYSGTHRSSDYLINQSVTNSAATRALTATISRKGAVSFTGKLNNQNPMVQVLLQNNRPSVPQEAGWLVHLLKVLHTKYHVDDYNAVGHSEGSVAWVYANTVLSDVNRRPQLNKLVTIAGHFNGWIGGPGKGVNPNTNTLDDEGRPKYLNTEYKKMLNNNSQIPIGVSVLNIYGNLQDGSHSDGRVTNESSESLKYLLTDQIASYQTAEIHGHAQHSQLHQNKEVVDKMDTFLWGKD